MRADETRVAANEKAYSGGGVSLNVWILLTVAEALIWRKNGRFDF